MPITSSPGSLFHWFGAESFLLSHLILYYLGLDITEEFWGVRYVRKERTIYHWPCKSVSDWQYWRVFKKNTECWSLSTLHSYFNSRASLILQGLPPSTSFTIYLWSYCSHIFSSLLSCWYCLLLWSFWQEFPEVPCPHYGKVLYFVCFELHLY